MRGETCFFTGHRSIPRALLPAVRELLYAEIDRLCREGFERFISGGAMGFDLLAAETVLEIKRERPETALILALPAKGYESRWPTWAKAQLERILPHADRTEVLAPFYTSGCMHARNRYMADRSSFCIAYMERLSGGTGYTVNYAQKIGCPVVNLAEKLDKAPFPEKIGWG